MKPKLPRVLLWTDKNLLDDFLKDPINGELYDYYLELIHCMGSEGGERRPVKIFNEFYYQLTKLEYENYIDVDVDQIMQDIKGNLGLLHTSRIVILMMYEFYFIRRNNPKEYEICLKALSNKISSFPIELSRVRFRRYVPRFDVDLTPKPINVKDLEGVILRWNEITNNFHSSSIDEVLNLWKTDKEKVKVLHLIEKNYLRIKRRLKKHTNNTIYSTPLVDDNFFSEMYKELGNKEESSCAVEEIDNSPTFTELSNEIQILKNKVAELESENEMLRSEKNFLKTKKNRERAFTLKMIVDYCKKHLNLDKASTVVAMLNKFLRDAKDYTEEECKLVDSVELEYLSRKYGDTIMGDKNEFNGNSTHNTITLPPGMTPQEAMKLLQNKPIDNGEEG